MQSPQRYSPGSVGPNAKDDIYAFGVLLWCAACAHRLRTAAGVVAPGH